MTKNKRRLDMKTAVLLDVSAMMYRAYFSLMNMSNSKGEPTGAVFGFTNILLSILDTFKPDYMVAAFDVKRDSLKRKEKFENYKADRTGMPEDLVVQVPKIEELLNAFGIQCLRSDGHEADDVLGTVAKKLSAQGVETFIITGDKDLSQVLGENIKIALLGKGDGDSKFKILQSEDDVMEQLGVKPHEIPDLFGLIGDKSDGIPGVRKIGEKKAVVMLDKYKNLEGIYENLDKLSDLPGIGKGLVKNIEEDRELAFLSRDLATIHTNVPLELAIENMSFKLNSVRMLDLFLELDFKSLIKKFGFEQDTSQEVKEKKIEKRELVMLDSESDSIFEELKKDGKASVLYNGVGFAVSNSKKTWYLPLFHGYLGARNLSKEFAQRVLNMDLELISYRFKDILNDGFKIKNLSFDAMLAQYLLTANTREEVEALVLQETGETLENYKELFEKRLPGEIDIAVMAEFMAKRNEKIYDIQTEMKEKLEKEELLELFENIEMPLIRVLSDMERTGIKIDKNYFNEYNKELSEKIDYLKEKIYETAKIESKLRTGKVIEEEFNLNSTKQLGEVLFDFMGIPPVKKTKTGYSTNQEVLEDLMYNGEEIAEYILEYRKLTKLQNTYVEALPKLVDKDSRLHTSFNQTGTATGRLSSSNPNLQNIPVKTSEGIKIRQGFVAKDGFSILAFDYSQIELRVLAELTNDANLVSAYLNDLDLHDLTARKLFDLDKNDMVSREQRSAAKIVNFSIIYGKTAFGLSKELSITRKEASDYIDKYFSQYPEVKVFEQKVIESAEKNGYVRTMFNRKRDIQGINSKNKNLKSQADRMAVNTVIQGSAADILKIVMVKIYDTLKGLEDIKLTLQVHDELIFEVKDDVVDRYASIIKDIMENTIDLKHIHLKANEARGKNWSEAK
jgi:DNA polymerase-1